jgi:hypothetical protein
MNETETVMPVQGAFRFLSQSATFSDMLPNLANNGGSLISNCF